ncbi:methyltransferase-like 26 [Lycorma delicatula]|uniref:methyltransferase-like 26 n=1 Tax=Lycorma delicatula TaxID=130591 RepID=UPI003F50E5EC
MVDMRSSLQFCSAADRNKVPIKETLDKYLNFELTSIGPKQFLLEISSGTGQHIAYFAQHFPDLVYQPTELDISLFSSINGYISESKLTNVNPPEYLDVRDPPSKWLEGRLGEESVDYVLNINLIHISEWKCTEGLFYGCSKILKLGKYLFTYGPYAFDGNITPESNVQFNEHLKMQNPEWGLRDVDRELKPLAAKNGMYLLQSYSLPANNHLLVWQKR